MIRSKNKFFVSSKLIWIHPLADYGTILKLVKILSLLLKINKKGNFIETRNNKMMILIWIIKNQIQT